MDTHFVLCCSSALLPFFIVHRSNFLFLWHMRLECFTVDNFTLPTFLLVKISNNEMAHFRGYGLNGSKDTDEIQHFILYLITSFRLSLTKTVACRWAGAIFEVTPSFGQ